MKAWQPVPTINSTIMLFGILSTIFISLGIALIVLSNQIVEQAIRYDSQCGKVNFYNTYEEMVDPKNNNCIVNFEVTKKLKAPVYVYYELDSFYQNHRKYVKSKNINQLQGETVSISDLDDCSPIIKYKDLRKFRQIPQKPTDPGFGDNDQANPCGLIAASYFNDTFVLKNADSNRQFTISSKDIAWPSDKNKKFKKSNKPQWTDVMDERFMVWMRTAALPNFRKLWGIINEDVNIGKYQINIRNYYSVESFNGKKSFVLSTANAFGGKNDFLGISYIVMGVICLLIFFLFIQKKIDADKKKAQKKKQ